MSTLARSLVRSLLASAGLLGLAATAHAGNIQQVTATPNTVGPGQPVQIQVTRGGSGNCGARVQFGDGAATDPFGFGSNPRSFTHSYANPGTYTITAQPRRRGNLDPCNGSPKTTTVTVGSGGGAVFERAPVVPGGLRKRRPEIGRTEDRDVRVRPKIRATDHEPIDELRRIPPQILQLRFTPQACPCAARRKASARQSPH